MGRTKNDRAWAQIFQDFHILESIERDQVYQISSSQINRYREARLMTKFDHREDLPSIFSKNSLSILPIGRWTYLIWKFDTHFDIVYNDTIHNIEGRNDLESIEKESLFSESIAINYALVTGMLQDLLWEECEPTVSWRMSSSAFSFSILRRDVDEQTINVDVDRAQIEIDWWFESAEKFLLIEAKMWKCNDFIVRQLFYPYRLRRQKIDKEIVPVFMTYSNDVFSFFVFRFNDENNYNSIELVRQQNYVVNYEPILLEEVRHILNTVTLIPEPTDTPFPQADDFEKCINLLEILNSSIKTNMEISEEYWFVLRQAGYYKNSLKYLWYVDFPHRWEMVLTPEGERIMTLSRRERILALISNILSHTVFNQTLRRMIENWGILRMSEIVSIMQQANLQGISWTTYRRRASTVSAWCKWIISLTYLID